MKILRVVGHDSDLSASFKVHQIIYRFTHFGIEIYEGDNGELIFAAPTERIRAVVVEEVSESRWQREAGERDGPGDPVMGR